MKNPTGRWMDLFDPSSIAQACGGYLVAALGWVIFFNVGDGLPVYSVLGKLFFVFLAEVTIGYFVAALAGMYLNFQKKGINSSHIFVLLGTAGFIKSLLIAWALLCAMFPQTHLGAYAVLVLLLIALLQAIYLVKGLKQMGPISTADALAAWIAGVLPWGILLFLVGVFGIWGIVLLF